MLKILVKKWNKNNKILRQELKDNVMNYNYMDLVKLTFENIYNIDMEGTSKLDLDNITEIDDGDYQGTLLYIIPFNRYQPCENEYIMTCVSYGSCSGCDTLMSIIGWNDSDKKPNNKQLESLMILCKDIIQNTIRPFNRGWKIDEDWQDNEV